MRGQEVQHSSTPGMVVVRGYGAMSIRQSGPGGRVSSDEEGEDSRMIAEGARRRRGSWSWS